MLIDIFIARRIWGMQEKRKSVAQCHSMFCDAVNAGTSGMLIVNQSLWLLDKYLILFLSWHLSSFLSLCISKTALCGTGPVSSLCLRILLNKYNPPIWLLVELLHGKKKQAFWAIEVTRPSVISRDVLSRPTQRTASATYIVPISVKNSGLLPSCIWGYSRLWTAPI